MVADISLVEDRTDRARQLDSREYHVSANQFCCLTVINLKDMGF